MPMFQVTVLQTADTDVLVVTQENKDTFMMKWAA